MQVEVIKGSASTLYGGGAIAGLVNLISKRPQEEGGVDLMVNGTSALGLDASSFYSEKFEKVGTTLFVSYNKGKAYDPSANYIRAFYAGLSSGKAKVRDKGTFRNQRGN